MTVEVCRDPPKNNKGHLECWDKHRCTDICRAPKTTAELLRAYEQRTGWRQIKVGECPLCGLSKAQEPDEDLWLEELALLAEATI